MARIPNAGTSYGKGPHPHGAQVAPLHCRRALVPRLLPSDSAISVSRAGCTFETPNAHGRGAALLAEHLARACNHWIVICPFVLAVGGAHGCEATMPRFQLQVGHPLPFFDI